MRVTYRPDLGEPSLFARVTRHLLAPTGHTWLRRALAARRQRRALMALDDRMLSDIGLSRSEAYREGSRSMFDLPHQ